VPAAAADPRAPLFVMAAATLWGTTGTAQALGPDGASSVAVGSARNVVGALVLVVVAAARGRLVAGARALPRRPLLLAAAATAAYQLCFFGGVRLAGVAIGTVVGVGSGPVWGGLLGWLGRGERPGRRWATATALALAGAVLLATTTSDGEPVDLLGIALALGAGLSYAAFALWSKDLTDDHDPDLVMTWVFALSAAALLPVGLAAGVEPLVSARGAAMVLWLGIGSLAVSYLLFGRGIAGVAVATATTLSLAEPLTAATLGVVVLDERLTGAAVVGMVLVFAGLAVLALRPRSTRSTVPPDL
jgi:drug/metabolite transporter, DME family